MEGSSGTGDDCREVFVDGSGHAGDCEIPAQKPEAITFTCADGNMYVDRIDWSQVDLTKPTDEVAAATGKSVYEVYRKRKELGVKAKRKFRSLDTYAKNGIKWDDVDLTRPTRELVAEFNVTRQAVSLARLKRGIVSRPSAIKNN